MSPTHVPPAESPFRWEGIDVKVYKEEGTHFHRITRQTLFAGDDLGCELRYFEIEPEGHSTLEKHEHVHSVMIVRGQGQAMVGNEILDLKTHSLVYVPPMTWHQFRANQGEPLGFLCLVRCDRDRPIRPAEADAAKLRQNPAIASFIKL